MTRPTISVCVTTYNQRDFIETCLRSILNQEVEADIEVLVGDDASTDGTSAVIAILAHEYGPRLRHQVRKPNMGAFDNMCDLIAHAQGDFIARVDGDDYWLPGKLDRQLTYLRTHPDCCAVFTNALTVDEAGNPIGHFNDAGDIQLDLVSLLRQGNILNNSSVLFRSSNSYAWQDVQEQIDYQLHLELTRNGKLGHIAEPLAAYRVNTQGSMVASANEYVRALYWQAILSVPRDEVSNADFAQGLADFLRRVVFRAIRTGDPALLRRWAAHVYAASPYGTIPTTVLVARNIARMASKMISPYLPFSRCEKHVLYRH